VNRGYHRILKKGKYRQVMPGPQVVKLAHWLVGRLTHLASSIEIAGSIRRKKPMPTDIDILIIPRLGVEPIKREIATLGKIISAGEKRISSRIQGVKVDVVITDWQSWAPALMYLTGPAGANIWNRRLAMAKGYKLNQYGLWDRKTGARIHTLTEKELYNKLGKEYRLPELRGTPRD
jgi:DNA polymerase (family X)